MKYAFIDALGSLTYNNGIKIQAIMWKDGLERLGHEVTLVNLWENIDFTTFDAVVIFALGDNMKRLVSNLVRLNENIIVAPIIDPDRSDKIYKFFFKYYGCSRAAISNKYHDTWTIKKHVKLWLVRSEEERHYVNYCLEIPQEKIALIPLNYRIPDIAEMPAKENFCLHVSRLDAPNKNVKRLIDAAKKYGFELKLAGHVFGEEGKQLISGWIGDAQNVKYLGEVSESELLDLYSRAKVFALPSLREGVGMVALEAAAYGAEIVLTNYGAPKEYYQGKVQLVNPESVDEIGSAIQKALNEGHSQPELRDFVMSHYSEKAICTLLNDSIAKAIR